MHKTKASLRKDILIFTSIFIFTYFFYLLTVKNNFVSSVERGRYALTRSIVENKTLNIDKFKDFSAPDLSKKNGHYYSRFPAGMPFMMAPAHFIAGKIYSGEPYIVHFAILALIAALTISLFYVIGRLGEFSPGYSATVATAMAFSTLIFSFAGGFWSHILSTFFVALSLIFLLVFLKRKNIFFLFFLSLCFALGISIDFPNGIIIFPLMTLALYRLTKLSKKKLFSGIFVIAIPIILVGSLIGMYNKQTFGSPFKIGQSASSSVGSTLKATIIPLNFWNAQGVFDDRRLIPGLVTQVFSPQRGILIFSPVLILAVFGFIPFYRKKKELGIALSSIFILNIVFYSLWQDYWGGWSFGPRYLIASIPALVIPLLYFLSYAKHKLFAEFLFCISVIFGIFINSLGAFTGTLLPCPCEGYLGIAYSPLYAIGQLGSTLPNSFFYKNYLSHYINADYFLTLLFAVLAISFLIISYLGLKKEKVNEIKL